MRDMSTLHNIRCSCGVWLVKTQDRILKIQEDTINQVLQSSAELHLGRIIDQYDWVLPKTMLNLNWGVGIWTNLAGTILNIWDNAIGYSTDGSFF